MRCGERSSTWSLWRRVRWALFAQQSVTRNQKQTEQRVPTYLAAACTFAHSKSFPVSSAFASITSSAFVLRRACSSSSRRPSEVTLSNSNSPISSYTLSLDARILSSELSTLSSSLSTSSVASRSWTSSASSAGSGPVPTEMATLGGGTWDEVERD